MELFVGIRQLTLTVQVCLLLINETRAKGNTYMWVVVTIHGWRTTWTFYHNWVNSILQHYNRWKEDLGNYIYIDTDTDPNGINDWFIYIKPQKIFFTVCRTFLKNKNFSSRRCRDSLVVTWEPPIRPVLLNVCSQWQDKWTLLDVILISWQLDSCSLHTWSTNFTSKD